MTKRSTKTRSTSRGRSGSGRSQSQRPLSNPSILGLVIAAAAILGLLYLVTGSDPLGLFTDADQKPGTGVVGSGGDWWQVYFTEPGRAFDADDLSGTVGEKLIEHIDGAQKSIHVAAFEFDLTPVAQALIAAHRRGVQVRWVTDDEYGIEADEEADHGQFAQLEKAGIGVRDDGRDGLMHNKFWIFDGQTVWTGSTNITANGIARNNNNVLIIDSRELASIFEREFAEMWDGKFGSTSPSTAGEQSLTIDGTPVQVLFAAEDEVASQLIPLIDGARSSIRFMAFSFTHDALGEAVLARAKAGVDVRGIFETRGSETEYSEMPRLYCAGVEVRQDGNPQTFHHKVFVIDDQLVFTGSFNFSQSADESNDENLVIVANRDIAAQYLLEFERRWAEANQPSAADMRCP